MIISVIPVTLSLRRVQNTKLNQVHSSLNERVRTLSVTLKKILHLNCRLVLRLGKYRRGINSNTIYVSSKILPYTYGVADNKAVDFSRLRLVLRLGKYRRGINSNTIYVSSKILPYTYGVADNKAVDFSRPSLQGRTWFTVSFSCHRCSFGCLVVLSIQWTDRYQNEQRACQEVNVHIK